MATRKLLKEREPAFDSFQATKGAKKSASKGKLVPPVKKTKPETPARKKLMSQTLKRRLLQINLQNPNLSKLKKKM